MHPFLVKHAVYPLYEVAAGRRILSALRDLERTQWLSEAQIADLQTERLAELLAHSYEHVPFYRQRMDQAGYRPEHFADPETFRQLPLLTKDDVLSYREQMVAANIDRSQLRLNATGGSTGHTLSFYNDRHSLDLRSAVTIRGDRWAGLDIGVRHARLWGAPLDIKAQERIAGRLANLVLNRLWLDCFRLSEDVLLDYVRQMRRFRPRVLVGYASALTTLAEFIESQGVRDIALSSVISSAETLFYEQRRRIERALGCKVYNRYGCREAGPLVVECQEGKLHVSADYVCLELLSDGQPVQPGEMGEIVITPLYSYGMPLIRYRTGDLGIAAEHEPCTCGRGLPTIDRIVGRASDMLVNSRGELFHGEYFTHLFYNQPRVRQFQVVQTDPEHLVFRVVAEPGFDSSLFDRLDERVQSFVGSIETEWWLVDEIPPLSSGKRCFTISHVSESLGQMDGSGNT